MADGRCVVLDSNVVLSALLFGAGAMSAFRGAWHRGSIVPLASAPTTRELLRVLAYPKFKLTRAQQEELLADYLPCTRAVRPQDHRNALNRLPICSDAHDQMFLELAQAGEAEMLVTGDKDLLVLNDPFLRRMGFRILSPKDALHILSA